MHRPGRGQPRPRVRAVPVAEPELHGRADALARADVDLRGHVLQPDVRLLGLLRLHVHDARGHVRLRLQRVLRADDAAELGAAGPEPDRHLPEHVLRPELRVLDVLLVLGA